MGNATISSAKDRTKSSTFDLQNSSKYPWFDVRDTSKCSYTLNQVKDFIENPSKSFFVDIDTDVAELEYQYFSSKMEYYLDITGYVFENSTMNEDIAHAHVTCVEAEPEVDPLETLCIKMVKLMSNIRKSSSYNEAYNYAKQLTPLFNQIRTNYDEKQILNLYQKVDDACQWFDSYKEDLEKEGLEAIEELELLKLRTDSTLRQYEEISESFTALLEEFAEEIIPVVNLGEDYILDQLTKLTMARQFVKSSFYESTDEMTKIIEDIADHMKDYADELTKGKDRLVGMYQKLFALKLPVINKYNVHQLGIVQKALETDDDQLKHIVDSLEDNMDEGITKLVEEIYQRLLNPIQDLEESLVLPAYVFLEHLTKLMENMWEYMESTKMTTEFFM